MARATRSRPSATNSSKLGLKVMVGIALATLIWLQVGLWFGPSGYFAQQHLATQLADRQAQVAELEQKNKLLTAQVVALKEDPRGLEARARHDLGMVKEGEVFYLIPDSEL